MYDFKEMQDCCQSIVSEFGQINELETAIRVAELKKEKSLYELYDALHYYSSFYNIPSHMLRQVAETKTYKPLKEFFRKFVLPTAENPYGTMEFYAVDYLEAWTEVYEGKKVGLHILFKAGPSSPTIKPVTFKLFIPFLDEISEEKILRKIYWGKFVLWKTQGLSKSFKQIVSSYDIKNIKQAIQEEA